MLNISEKHVTQMSALCRFTFIILSHLYLGLSFGGFLKKKKIVDEQTLLNEG